MFQLFIALFLSNAHADCGQPNSVDVYILAGQSNAVGMPQVKDIPDQSIAQSNPNKMVWNYNTNKLEPLVLGANNNLLHNWGGNFGPEAMIGHLREMKDSSPFIFLKYAYCGSSLHNDWNSRKPGTFYHGMMTAAKNMENALSSSGKTACYKTMFWMQGESDSAGEAMREYSINLRNLISDVRTSVGNNNMPVVLGRIHMDHTDNKKFAKEQDDVVAKDHYVEVVETNDLPQFSDALHFTAPGQISLGERFFTASEMLVEASKNGTTSASLKAYPVPYSPRAGDLHLEIEDNFFCATATLTVVDMTGRMIPIFTNKEIGEGTNLHQLSISSAELGSLASGVYILMMNLDQCAVYVDPKHKVINQKIVLIQ